MTQGVLYWNSGSKLLTRLTVSIASLREAGYDGRITVLWANTPDAFLDIAEKWVSSDSNLEFCKVDEKPGHDAALVAKTKLNQRTPFDVTVFLDSDTLVLKPFPELFELGEKHGFVVTHFAGMDLKKGSIASRVRAWSKIDGLVSEFEYKAAVAVNKGINIGVMAFCRDASIFTEWTALAEKGTKAGAFIPDEVSCQYLIARHPHAMAPGIFNASCNRDLITPDTRVVHFHGRKHCSLEKTARTGAAALWIKTFQRYWKEDRLGLREVVANYNYRDENKWIPT